MGLTARIKRAALNRGWIAMDDKARIKSDWDGGVGYYDDAEQQQWLDVFWKPDTVFRPMFGALDTQRTVELACGHGRHASYLLRHNMVGSITLIDINESNIEFCRRRFREDNRVSFHVNAGNDLPLRDRSATALFCYDAMVHFEYDDVADYLKACHRVLLPGGRALLHHSNNDRHPGKLYSDNIAGRNFMSAALFAHMSLRAGLRILEQRPIPWSGHMHLDCISLVERP